MTLCHRVQRWTWQFGRGAAGVVFCALALLAPRVEAQDFPSRPVKIIVPFPAGGTADAMPRVVAEWLSRKWGQSIVIENRSGAGGNVGAEAAYKSDPDGYTLLSSPAPPLVINHNLYPKLAFNPLEFVPIVVMGRVPNALLVNPEKVKANSVADFIADAKANPDKYTYASQGNGTTAHLTAEMFCAMAGIKARHVPYRGAAPGLTDLIAGTVDIMFDNLGVSLQQVQGGKLKLLGVASGKRLASLPNVPAIGETLPGFEAWAWFAIVAPPKTPMAIVAKINADANEALRDPEVRKRFDNFSAEIVGGTQQTTADYFRKEVDNWHNVIKAANVKLE